MRSGLLVAITTQIRECLFDAHLESRNVSSGIGSSLLIKCSCEVWRRDSEASLSSKPVISYDHKSH